MPRNLIVSLLLLAGCASMTPRANTRDEVVAYVNRAAGVVAKNGPSCDTFKDSRWRTGDWYVYVQEAGGRVLCHPNAQLVGRNASEIVDANGKRVGEELAAAAGSAAGHGWVDYVWPRPGQTTPVPKSTYMTRVTGPDGKTYYVGSGGYGLQ